MSGEVDRWGNILWDCSCGSPGVKNLGQEGFCEAHLSDLYQKFKSLQGVGYAGLRYGNNVKCVICGATWEGQIGELCNWCGDTLRSQQEQQRELTLRVPTFTQETKQHILRAWGKRLKVQVEAGNITKEEAERALQRAIRSRTDN